MPERDTKDKELTAELKVQVNEYLLKWFSALGFANLIAIIAGLAYIFFWIPQQAVSEAKALLEAEMQETITVVRTTLRQVANDALVKSGEAKALSSTAKTEAIETAEALKQLKEQALSLSKNDTVNVIAAAKVLADHPEVGELLKMADRLDALSKQVKGMNSSIDTKLTDCRVCIQLTSNSNIDGAKQCSSWTSAGKEVSTGASGWAEAGPGSTGGGKYAARAWLSCR